MSTVKANNHQIGQSGTATNNFTLYQPSTPDGTVRLAVGNSGATTGDVLSVSNTGLSVTGTLSATGNVTLGDATTDTITLTGTVQPGVVISGSSSGDALRITQTGAGNALLVEDSANPDSSPFVVTAAGDMGIGTNSPAYKLDVIGSSRIQSSSGYNFFFQTSATTARINYLNDAFSANISAAYRATDFSWQKGDGSEILKLDSSGNLGLGVTPSAINQGRAIELLAPGMGLWNGSGSPSSIYMTGNAYWNSGFKYGVTGQASHYYQYLGQHVWSTAPSGFGYGTAATSLTSTQNGNSYTIVSAGTTDFTLIGAANNNVGTTFTKSGGTGTGTGTVSQNITFTQAMTLDASGNLGVGTTSPSGSDWNVNSTVVQVKKNDSSGGLFKASSSNVDFIFSAGNGLAYIATTTNTPITFSTNNGTSLGERARITSGGDFLVKGAGTAGSTDAFQVSGSAPANAARITSAGDLLVGTTDAGATTGVGVKTVVSATIPAIFTVFNTAGGGNAYNFYNTNATNNGYRFYVKVDGGIANYQANNLNLSDIRKKTDIQPAGSYLDKICAIPVKTFLYKDQSDTARNLGVIAQDVDAVAPELVDRDGFGETPEGESPYLSIYQTDLQYALMKCIQELKAQNDELRARVAALEGTQP